MSDIHIMSGKDADAVEQEVNRLRAELAAERKAQLQMLSQMQKAIDAEKDRVAKLREALEPFAKLLDGDYQVASPSLSDLRRARAVLEETKP